MAATDLRDVILRDGTTLRLRRPVAEDVESLLAFFSGLSEESLWMRFRGLPRLDAGLVQRYVDVADEERGALVKKAPERMLWASNWPHPSVPKEQRPADEDLLDLLLDWAPDESARRRMLVDNPAQLYGFQ